MRRIFVLGLCVLSMVFCFGYGAASPGATSLEADMADEEAPSAELAEGEEEPNGGRKALEEPEERRIYSKEEIGVMSLVIPEGWEAEAYPLNTEDASNTEDGVGEWFGIVFRRVNPTGEEPIISYNEPAVMYEADEYTEEESTASGMGDSSEIPAPSGEDKDEVIVKVRYYTDRIGICGTGVTEEKVQFPGGLSGTKCTEVINDEVWFSFFYDVDCGGTLVADASMREIAWNTYEEEIMDILGTMEFQAADDEVSGPLKTGAKIRQAAE